MSARTLRLHLESTGDRRFDAILGGGIPAQSVVVVAGEPGSGKTAFIADNVIQLRYLEMGGRLDRGLSVLKARGIAHQTALRLLHIERGALRLSRPSRTRDGVLTGRDRRRGKGGRR